MRSAAEIRFRLAQEALNFWLYLRPPQCDLPPTGPLALLPEPEAAARRLRGTPYAAEIERIAEEIRRHRFPLLGVQVETGPEIRWRRDYTAGIETPPVYFRRIPYLDARRSGDHKIVWELNRHQHLTLLAQAWLLTGRNEFGAELAAQLESWLAANPFQRGINWTSALEVAFRALSWIWIYHLASDRLEERTRRALALGLYRHGVHLERNLSVYFSPNTHLLGEAVALHALGTFFPGFPAAARWQETGRRIVGEEMNRQVRDDGSHFEQSAYYHVYALDMFLFHAVLAAPCQAYVRKLERMADYLAALLGPAGAIPLMGDDDGGRFFHPFGRRDRFGRATLATASALLGRVWPHGRDDVAECAAWWLGERAWQPAASAPVEPSSRMFDGAGLAVMAAGALRVYADAGPMGPGRAGHGHADALSIVVRRGEEEILIDPGAYTYVADPAARDCFRGTAAHNTIRIDGRDQAVPLGPFGWSEQPDTGILEWSSEEEADTLVAECRYGGFTHRRRIRLEKKAPSLIVIDEVEGPPGKHLVEQFWRPGQPVEKVREHEFAIGGAARLCLDSKLAVESGEGGEYGWRSPAFGVRLPAPVVRASVRCLLPLRLETAMTVPPPSVGETIEPDWCGH